MKKMISLILAVLMVGLCASGIAAETVASEDAAFLRIKEGITAQVFEKPGDGQAIDTIPGGRICGQLGEAAEAGTAWFRVFYLNSSKAGATGYISAGDAEQLTESQLKALMEDPASLNEILDLIDAMDAYLSGKDGNGNPENSGEKPDSNALRALYENAMAKLKKVFGTNVPSQLGDLGRDLANKAVKAGKELLNQAKDEGKKLKDSVSDALSSLAGKDINEIISNLKDRLNKTVDRISERTGINVDAVMDRVSDALKKLRTQLEGSVGSAGSVTDILNNIRDWLNGTGSSSKSIFPGK